MIAGSKRLTITFFLLFLLSGCGAGESEKVQEDIPTVDWKTNGFVVSGEVIDEQGLWTETYVPWEHEDVSWDEAREENFVRETVYRDGKMYQLNLIVDRNEKDVEGWNAHITSRRGILEIFDTFSMTGTIVELGPEQMGLKDTEPNGMAYFMDMLSDQEYVFETIQYGYDETEGLFYADSGVTYLDPEGNIQSVDRLDVYLEKGFIKGDRDYIKECCYDGRGYAYIIPDEAQNELYVFDREGKTLVEYRGDDRQEIHSPMRTEEGELIFPIERKDGGFAYWSLAWFNLDDGEFHTLADLDREWVKQLYGMQGNDLYYEGQYGIVKWNVVSGERRLVFRFDENGITGVTDFMLVLRDGKSPALRFHGTVNGQEYDWITAMSEEPVDRPEAVRVVSLADTSPRVKSCTTLTTRMNPNYVFVYEDRGNKDLEDYRTQIIAELAAGKGPDILYVSLEDMELMQKRGLLTDLGTLLSEKVLEGVIPGVLEIGTVDGTLAGLAPGIQAETLMIGDKSWAGDSWTLEDVLELMESGKIENKLLSTNLLTSNGFSSDASTYYASLAALVALINPSLENSFLIDWEKRESHFEDERFIRLLECFGKYGSGTLEGNVKEGNVMIEVMLSSSSSISDFLGTHLLEDGHYVGYPAEGGNGNYLVADGVLVVNKNLTDPTAVSAFLECLWGEEIQDMDNGSCSLAITYPPIDKIIYEENGGNHHFTPGYGAIWMGYGIGSRIEYNLTVFEDGTTSMHEADEFLRRCVPAPKTYAGLERIIFEELSAYYEEAGRTAEDTAGIIDSRVQVYLDEGN